MNRISKLGLFIFIVNFILMIALILLNQEMPDFTIHIFWVSIIVTIAGAIITRRKNQLS